MAWFTPDKEDIKKRLKSMNKEYSEASKTGEDIVTTLVLGVKAGITLLDFFVTDICRI